MPVYLIEVPLNFSKIRNYNRIKKHPQEMLGKIVRLNVWFEIAEYHQYGCFACLNKIILIFIFALSFLRDMLYNVLLLQTCV